MARVMRRALLGFLTGLSLWWFADAPQAQVNTEGSLTDRVPAIPPDDWRSDVAAFARRIVSAGLTPGMGVAVARGDRVEYVEGFGVADLETGRPVGEATPFYIASSTKSLTALAVALAASRGEIDLAAPVSRYLPQLYLKAPLSADSIRIEDLLTMTHGIADGGPVVFRTAYTGEFTRQQLLDLLSEYPPSDASRAFVYGNLGYNILGLVLEARYKTSWKDVVAREVLGPLRMTETSAHVSRLDVERIAHPHVTSPEGFRRVALGKNDANMHAAGGHFASARDLARYIAMHQSAGILDDQRVFPRRPVIETQETHARQDRRFGPFRRFGWGYGWDLGLYDGDTLVHRFGAFPGYRSHMSFMPAHQLGVVVLVNGSGPASPAADLVATYIYDRLRGALNLEAMYAMRLEEQISRASDLRARLTAHLAERSGRQRPLPLPLDRYAGTFENRRFGRMVVSVSGETLEVQMGAAKSLAEVFDAATNRLRVELTGRGAVLEFVFSDANAPATAVRYRGEVFSRFGGAEG